MQDLKLTEVDLLELLENVNDILLLANEKSSELNNFLETNYQSQ